MKKLLCLLISFFLMFNTYALENEYFSINIPKDFSESINDNTYIYSKDNEYISIIITNNKDNYNVNKFTESDINSQKEYIKNSYKEKLNVDITINNMSVIDNKTINYLEYDIYIPTKNTIGHDIYQKCRLYTTDNYVYSITYNNDKEISENNINTLNSLLLKDSYLRNINIYLYLGLFIIIIIILILITRKIIKKRY